jgi:hypothetical protein
MAGISLAEPALPGLRTPRNPTHRGRRPETLDEPPPRLLLLRDLSHPENGEEVPVLRVIWAMLRCAVGRILRGGPAGPESSIPAAMWWGIATTRLDVPGYCGSATAWSHRPGRVHS